MPEPWTMYSGELLDFCSPGVGDFKVSTDEVGVKDALGESFT